MLRTGIFIFCILIAGNSWAQSSVPKDRLFTMLTSLLPAKLCKHPAFLKCVENVTRAQCTFFMARALKGCSMGLRNSYPDTVSVKDAEKIGELLGDCAGLKFQKTFVKDPEKTEACAARYRKKK